MLLTVHKGISLSKTPGLILPPHSVKCSHEAPVAELADALDLGSSALGRGSSSLPGRTTQPPITGGLFFCYVKSDHLTECQRSSKAHHPLPTLACVWAVNRLRGHLISGG